MTAVFALPDHLWHHRGPEFVAADERHLAAVRRRLRMDLEQTSRELDDVLQRPAGAGRQAVERDDEVHRLEGRLRLLRRHSLDLCLGRTVACDGAVTYVGRLGLGDGSGGRLLVDWRSPAAAPFFAATTAHPDGIASRRRYRWRDGQIVDFWDEVLSPGADTTGLALDDDSAFLAGLADSRSSTMRDVLGTIATDQDAIIRADSHGALVVDGGPGTGKTVVALHRVAYMLHSDPRLSAGRGSILVIGPHDPYLAYIADVLPSLGEDGVVTCTPRDLVPEGADAVDEPDPRVAALKSDLALVRAVDAAIAVYEEPPTTAVDAQTPWGEVRFTPDDWAEAFAVPGPHVPHNAGRGHVWEALAQIALDRLALEEQDPAAVEAALRRDDEIVETLERAWIVLEPADVVADLWAVPAYLRHCAPLLSRDEAALLRRPESAPWTTSDLPLLDAARRRLGDPRHERREAARRRSLATQRAGMDRAVDELLAAMEHDDGEGLWSSLRQAGLREALVDESGLDAPSDPLAGPFAHVVVDEAQELTDAQWAMILARCPSRSLTVVGDRAQARRGFLESWRERLARVGVADARECVLTVNYRTPREVMEHAAPVIRAAVPDAPVPESIRSSGRPVRHVRTEEVGPLVDRWLAEHGEGVVCVIGDPVLPSRDRVRRLSPTLAKGLEFDLVVLVDPGAWGDGIEASVDRYVAMTRATSELVIASPPRQSRAPKRRSAAAVAASSTTTEP